MNFSPTNCILTPGREDDDVETKLYTKADVNARKEAVQFGKSFIQNENGDMIGPLGSSDRRVIQNQYVQNLGKIAKQCNLSPVTIKKVLASTHAAGSNKITTHELAERMGSTVRNANRSNS